MVLTAAALVGELRARLQGAEDEAAREGAPRVVGGYLLDRPRDPLYELARSADPLRRRTAMTAPLAFTALKYAGQADEAALVAFLDQYAGRLQRPALRYAVEKLAPEIRRRHLG
jgi:hypothetical protein